MGVYSSASGEDSLIWGTIRPPMQNITESHSLYLVLLKRGYALADKGLLDKSKDETYLGATYGYPS